MARTSTNPKNGVGIRTVALPMTLVLGIGTGGEYTFNYQRIREAKLVVGTSRPTDRMRETIDVATAADDLARIKSILKLTTKELAQTLGVSRQAIYNWRSGAHIKGHNLLKLDSLSKAADVIIGARIAMSPLLLDRKLPGGKTLLESISAGEDGTTAACSLVNLLAQEAEQRKTIDAMLAEHKSPKTDAFDYGVPSFKEG